jgi:hypothetical protein
MACKLGQKFLDLCGEKLGAADTDGLQAKVQHSTASFLPGRAKAMHLQYPADFSAG